MKAKKQEKKLLDNLKRITTTERDALISIEKPYLLPPSCVKLKKQKDELLEFCKTLFERLKETEENTGGSSYGDTFFVLYKENQSIGEKLEELIKNCEDN